MREVVVGDGEVVRVDLEARGVVLSAPFCGALLTTSQACVLARALLDAVRELEKEAPRG